MIPEGTDAPGFELPGLVDGERRRVALEEFVGRDVVVLVFYPADFNPACDDGSDLDELDLFAMQKDVTVLAVGPDTLYSHAAFADAYDLTVPLLSDARREVAEAYGVTFEDEVGQRLFERAVAVVDHDGSVQYTWHTRDLTATAPVDEVKDAIAETGDDDTAFARYRIGHAHYTEGRRAFTSAMHALADSEWLVAQSDFVRAREAFETAADHFDSAARFVDDEALEGYYARVQEKATALWQAADWLSQSASAFARGAGAEAQRLRDDAERPLTAARDLGDPVSPDDWPPDTSSWAEPAGREVGGILPDEEPAERTPGIDVDAEVTEAVATDKSRSATATARRAERPSDSAATDPDADAPDDDDDVANGDDADDGGDAADGDDADDIDEAELAAIQAELAASHPEDPAGDLDPEPTSVVDGPPVGGDGSSADEDDGSPGLAGGSAGDAADRVPPDEGAGDDEERDARDGDLDDIPTAADLAEGDGNPDDGGGAEADDDANARE